jgi:transcriptional regulator with XRE-family HTH domain
MFYARSVPVTPDELHVLFVTRIRALAKERGLSIEALASAAGVSESYLWKVLAGSNSPTIEIVAKLASGLGVDPVELFRGGVRAARCRPSRPPPARPRPRWRR